MKCINKNSDSQQSGFIMATVVAFLPVLIILLTVASAVALQTYRTSIHQDYIKQAQLASTTALDFAKEQYELDINYAGTSEQTLYSTSRYTVTYEVLHLGYVNSVNTQADIRGIGRVYETGKSTPLYSREIKAKITHSSGASSSVRFIFIIDNSGSMDSSEFSDVKATINTAVAYVVNNVPAGQVAVVQHGTNVYSKEHRYDVTVPFTNDLVTATSWDRQYGPGTTGSAFLGSHLSGTMALMRYDDVYEAGGELDLAGAENVQYIVFTDAEGADVNYFGYYDGCCSAIKRVSSEPASWHTGNGSPFVVMDQHGEFNVLKDGSVFSDDGYPGLTSQFTVLNINTYSPPINETEETSAAIASPGGSWTGVVDANPGDPEGEGVIPRRYISTSLAVTDPNDIIDIINEIIENELSF